VTDVVRGLLVRINPRTLTPPTYLTTTNQVTKLSDLTAINERCMELQQTKRSAAANKSRRGAPPPSQSLGLASLARSKAPVNTPRGCPFLQRTNPRSSGGSGSSAAAGKLLDPLEDFKELVLAAPADVEDLARMGRSKGVCAYYGSRLAVPEADIILAPYSALLSADARAALGLDPEGSVLVFDEAHNLLDAVNGAHGSSVTGEGVEGIGVGVGWGCEWCDYGRWNGACALKSLALSTARREITNRTQVGTWPAPSGKWRLTTSASALCSAPPMRSRCSCCCV